jgi:hypothetical protein
VLVISISLAVTLLISECNHFVIKLGIQGISDSKQMNDSNTTELNWPGGKIEKLKNM